MEKIADYFDARPLGCFHNPQRRAKIVMALTIDQEPADRPTSAAPKPTRVSIDITATVSRNDQTDPIATLVIAYNAFES